MYVVLLLAINLMPVIGVLSQVHCLKGLLVKSHQTGLTCNYSYP